MTNRTMKFNPAFLSDEELIQSFVVRHADLELITEIVRNNTNQSNQHVLAIGPRGIGKTTLVLRVAAEIRRDAALSQKWYPLVFGEESYRVCSPGEFWLEAIFHLARQTKESRWQRTYKDLHDIQDEDRLRESALAQLMDFADEQNKRILLIVENLHQLLGDQIHDNDAWTLRHTLQNEPRVMLLATATTRFEEIENHGKAMFELFKPHDLKPLDTEDCRAVWQAKTGNLFTYNQIRPIQILTGGNPRLITIIAQFAKDISLQHLMRDLIQLVDDHTEYFKTHLDNLAVVERKVYLALAEIWEPATAKEVAAAARLDVNKTSALLKRLIERGAVVVADDRKRTKSYYVAERMYNIYYLMRRRGGPSSRVKAVVRFLIPFYGRIKAAEIITKEACCLPPDQRKDHYAAYQILLEETPETERTELLNSTPAQFFDREYLPKTLKDYIASKEENERNDKIRQLRLKSSNLFKNNNYKEAENIERQIIELSPNDTKAWNNIGVLLTCQQQYPEAEKILKKVIEIEPENNGALILLGMTLSINKKYKEAEALFRKIVKTKKVDISVWKIYADTLHKNQNFDELEKICHKIIEIQPNDVETWNNLGIILIQNEKYSEAENAFREGLNIDSDDDAILFGLAWVLYVQNKFEEAEYYSRKSLENSKNNSSYKFIFACILLEIGKLNELQIHLVNFLSDKSFVKNSTDAINDFVLSFAAKSNASQALEILQSSPSAEILEPLIVGLRLYMGEDERDIKTPLEILEIGKDVKARIEERKAELEKENRPDGL